MNLIPELNKRYCIFQLVAIFSLFNIPQFQAQYPTGFNWPIGFTQDGISNTYSDGNFSRQEKTWYHIFRFSHDGTCLPIRRDIYNTSFTISSHAGFLIWHYDDLDRPIRLNYNSSSIGFSGGTSTTIEYNQLNQVTLYETYFDGSYGLSDRHEYEYDSVGNLLQYRFTGINEYNSQMDYLYNDEGRLYLINHFADFSGFMELFNYAKTELEYENGVHTRSSDWTRETDQVEFEKSTTWDYEYDAEGNTTEIFISTLDTVLNAMVPSFYETFLYTNGKLTEHKKQAWDSNLNIYVNNELWTYDYYFEEHNALSMERWQKWYVDIQEYKTVLHNEYEIPCEHSNTSVVRESFPVLISNPSDFPKILFDENSKPEKLDITIYDLGGRLLFDWTFPSNLDLYFEFPEAQSLQSGVYILRVQTENSQKTFKWEKGV